MRIRTFITLVLSLVSLPLLGSRAVRDDDTVALRGNRPPFARAELDIGALDGDLALERMVLVLKHRTGTEAELQRLIEAQQNPASPQYHQWLSPEEFGAKFGATDADVADVVSWLQRNGFRVDEVARGRGWINFSGKVSDVERVLKTPMRQYRVGDRVLHANATDPEIPRALADVVLGIASLDNNFTRPLHAPSIRTPQYGTGPHYLAPSDYATIYNLTPLYDAGTNGSGQTIAIVGRTDIDINDVRTFRSTFGLPANDPVLIHNGAAPGINADEGEADLDVEWSGAVARNATIDYVISASTQTSDGVVLSAQYIVNHNVAPIVSVSYGLCEELMSPSASAFWANLWLQASVQGITVFVSSGDAGAAGCDNPNTASSGTQAAVSGLCSTDFNVCVGGTQFLDTSTPGAYWSSGGNALSYIPESAWNESGTVSGGNGIWSTGGGASILYSKPSWQSCPGVPGDGARDVPDLSLSAAVHDGYLIVQEGGLYVSGGTSAAAPSMAGIMALLVQKTGGWEGNANPTLYTLARNQYLNGTPVVFHDVTTGNNSVPGQSGFNCTTGYDRATGVGSVDASAFVANWPSGGTGSVQELIVDGGFEQATSGTSAPGWTVLPASGHTIIVTAGSFPHSGTKYALLGGSSTTATDILKQTVTIPSNATSVTVSFWLNIVTSEVIGNGPYDQLSAAFYTTGGVWVADVAKFTNENAVASNNTNGTYFKAGPIDMTAYRGQTLQLVFEGDTDSSLATTFRLDDVSIQVKTGSADQLPSTSITSPSNGATVSGTVSVNATASDDLGITSLDILIDGSVRTSSSTNPPPTSTTASYSWNTTLSSNGQHTLTSRVQDTFGHVVTSSNVIVTVSNATTCTSYTINPASASPTYLGGSTTVTITGSPAGCLLNWTASGNGSWITVSPQSGTNTGPVTVSWALNPTTSQRSGTATIAGKTFTVTQEGGPANISGFYLVTPCRLIDTRGGSALAAAATRNVVVSSQCGIPSSGVTSLSINVTVVSPPAVGWLTLYAGPLGSARPYASTINFTTGRTIANNALLTVGADGSINVYNGGTASTDFFIDVNGYFK